MIELPLELRSLILAELKDDLIQVFRLMRVSKSFHQDAIYVLNNVFKIKLPSSTNPPSIKKCIIDLGFVYHSHEKESFDLYFDSGDDSIQHIDIVYRFIRNFSIVVKGKWMPSLGSHPRNVNYLTRYMLIPDALVDHKYIDMCSDEVRFQSQKDCCECIELLNRLEEKTTFIKCLNENQNYCLLFNKYQT